MYIFGLLLGSIYLTLAIAIERYTTVCHPFFKVNTCLHNNSVYYQYDPIHNNCILTLCLVQWAAYQSDVFSYSCDEHR